MEISEWTLQQLLLDLRKKEQKDNIMENSYTMFQIREAVGRSQMFFKMVFLKTLHEKSCVRVLF